TSAPCPLCATPARRIHSDYERTLADLPWATYRVRLQLCVRKWFCRNRACPRRIFTERLPTVAAPWARRTLRLPPPLGRPAARLGGGKGGGAPGPGGEHAPTPPPPVARAPPPASPGVAHAPGAGGGRFCAAET